MIFGKMFWNCCFFGLGVPRVSRIKNKYLENINYHDTIEFVPPITSGKVIKVYDGDTITVASKLPYKESPIYRFRIRLSGIDAPEIKGETEEEKNAAKISRDILTALVKDKIVTLKNTSTEKYGRILADVYLNDVNINKLLLEQNHALPYDGGTKLPYKGGSERENNKK